MIPLLVLELITTAGMLEPQSVHLPPVRASSVSIEADALARLARQFEEQQRLEEAERVWSALSEDPAEQVRDQAQLGLSRIAVLRGDGVHAIVLLRQLLASNPDQAEARLFLASLLVERGNEQAAREELRLSLAGDLDERSRAMVTGALRQLADRRSFSYHVQLAIAPDTNISGATHLDTLQTVIGDFDVSEDSKARSGVGVNISGGARFQQPLSETAHWMVSVRSNSDLYRDAAYRRVYAELAMGPRIRLSRGRVSLEVGAGRYWLSGEPVFDQLHASAFVEQALADDIIVNAGWTTRLISSHRNPLEEGNRHRLSLGATHFIDGRTGISLQASGERAALADPGYSNLSWRAALSGFRHIGPIALGARAQLGGLETDERLSLFPDKRRDTYRQAELSVHSRSWSVLGLLPYARLSRERNRSSIAFYDFARTRLEVGMTKAY